MQFESKIYKSADIDPVLLSQQMENYRPEDVYGYFLVDDMLVPKSLVTRIYHHLCDITFDYGYVWSVQELLGHDFWNSLNRVEQSVAGVCMLIIIENGYSIPVSEEFEIRH